MLQPRAYGPGLSDAERAEILARVTSPRPGLVVFREIVVQSPLTIELMHDHLQALTEDQPTYVMVLDLADCHRPDAPTRAALRRRTQRMAHRVRHLALVVGDNLFMKAMAKTLAAAMGYRSVTLHHDLAAAMRDAERAHAG